MPVPKEPGFSVKRKADNGVGVFVCDHEMISAGFDREKAWCATLRVRPGDRRKMAILSLNCERNNGFVPTVADVDKTTVARDLDL